MYLSDVFDALSHGELAHLFMGGEGQGGIQPCDYPKIISYVNLGLAELYKRFPMKIGDVVVRMHDAIQTYYLDPKYAVTNTDSNEPIKYIHDSVYQPFKGGVNKIEQVFDELGRTLFLNDPDEYWSIFTPSYNSIQVPWPEKENQLIVHYRANHVPIIFTPDLEPETVDVSIPPGYLEALLFYVGSREFASLNSDGNAEGNNYVQKFEQSCAKITDLNLMNDNNTRNSNLDKAGWV